MDAKRLFWILVLVCILPVGTALAGETILKGTASCVMPNFFELETRTAAPQGSSAQATPAAPVPAAASGDYEVQKEEKLIQTEESIVLAKNSTESEEKITVYTVCAK